jgi:hypothetical protein
MRCAKRPALQPARPRKGFANSGRRLEPGVLSYPIPVPSHAVEVFDAYPSNLPVFPALMTVESNSMEAFVSKPSNKSPKTLRHAKDERPRGRSWNQRASDDDPTLLNEFLKEHREVQEQKATITQLNSRLAKQEATAVEQQKEIKALTASLKEQAALIKKVSDRLELNRPASQVAENNQISRPASREVMGNHR